jgi:hypothetical protein
VRNHIESTSIILSTDTIDTLFQLFEWLFLALTDLQEALSCDHVQTWQRHPTRCAFNPINQTRCKDFMSHSRAVGLLHLRRSPFGIRTLSRFTMSSRKRPRVDEGRVSPPPTAKRPVKQISTTTREFNQENGQRWG